MTSRRRFEASEDAVRAARNFVAETIADAPIETRESVSVMVSELATNALLHAASGFEVSVDRSDHSVVVSVSDRGVEGRPLLQAPGSSEPHGRGLRVVDALSAEWGVTTTGDEGKTVWFRINLEPPMSHYSTSGDPDAASFDLIGRGDSTPVPDASVIVATDSECDAPNSFRRGNDPRFRAETSRTTAQPPASSSVHARSR